MVANIFEVSFTKMFHWLTGFWIHINWHVQDVNFKTRKKNNRNRFKNEFVFSFVALVDLSHPDDGSTSPIDIVAVGFQEIVDLNASNIMAAR